MDAALAGGVEQYPQRQPQQIGKNRRAGYHVEGGPQTLEQNPFEGENCFKHVCVLLPHPAAAV